jgi:hypothetical protein
VPANTITINGTFLSDRQAITTYLHLPDPVERM